MEPSNRPALTREAIVTAAIGLADEGGLEAVTMRGVGQRLGASGMALYRHVANRDDLVALMVDRVAGQFAYPEPRPADWREGLAEVARQDWRSFFAHPWMLPATATARPALGPHLLANMEWSLACLDDFDLPAHERLYLLGTVTGYAQGLALVWLSSNTPETRRGTSDWWREEVAKAGDYPRLSALVHELSPEVAVEEEFEFGLTRILDGVAAHLSTRARP
ncbi:AcrR family transcriptional regulator [Crossiella equi]|uniref:AcrR family transcriptional regulator n=1 Tax=Crossiella equi TaxID=130796 RepID=A0ABS5ASX7_9PSEU|nr:TetR/AcrR family transcriptional regulator [Crossiella equi]MBP2479327.1 AcrR family transcriptional regulator [Crossiella equi]